MNENILTENEEKMLVLMLLHIMHADLNTDDRLQKSLELFGANFSKLVNNLEIKGLISEPMPASGWRHLSEEGFFLAEQIYLKHLFPKDTYMRKTIT